MTVRRLARSGAREGTVAPGADGALALGETSGGTTRARRTGPTTKGSIMAKGRQNLSKTNKPKLSPKEKKQKKQEKQEKKKAK